MIYYAKIVERLPLDPQESRALAKIRVKSALWLLHLADHPEVIYCFRNDNNNTTHIFFDAGSHARLHELLDSDPLSMHATLDIEPLLTPVEMATSLEKYLNKSVLTEKDYTELQFPRHLIDPNGVYFLARKTIRPFSPLLSVDEQDIIHFNTLISQSSHADPREVADFNPVAKPVGILLMRASSLEEVERHVQDCQVFVDSEVHIERLLTPQQAAEDSRLRLKNYMVGNFIARNEVED